jgi:predicted nucleic acid-binding protein
MSSGLTLDTGVLVALERRNARALALITEARHQSRTITVPAPVITEWWRGQKGPAAKLLDAFDIEPLTRMLAQVAGAALGHVRKGPSTTDAVVMASAAQRGDIVLTSDYEDLSILQGVFRSVKLLRV